MDRHQKFSDVLVHVCLLLWTAVIVLVLALRAVDSYAAKPPEKLGDIHCTVFTGIPIMEEARQFLDDMSPPMNLDFRTRVAYTDDWLRRRSVAVDRYDRFLAACKQSLEESKESGD